MEKFEEGAQNLDHRKLGQIFMQRPKVTGKLMIT